MAGIIVTGAGKGIGFELVKILASRGHTVIGISRNVEKLKLLGDARVTAISFDLSSGNFQELLAEVGQLMPQIDILVNNAGAIVNKPFKDISPAEMQEVYQVNVFSVMQTIQTLEPLLSRSSGAHVVNISSMGGFQGAAKFAGLSVYSSSKAALVCLTECLAEEYREKGIKFNVLCLGAVQTEMLEKAFPGYKAPVQAVVMAGYIADFCLSSGSVMNGRVIPVSLSTP